MRFFIHASIAEILDFAPNAKLCLYDPVGGESTLANHLNNQIQAVFLEDESRPNIYSLGITRKIYQNLEYTSSTYIVCTTNYSIDSAELLPQ